VICLSTSAGQPHDVTRSLHSQGSQQQGHPVAAHALSAPVCTVCDYHRPSWNGSTKTAMHSKVCTACTVIAWLAARTIALHVVIGPYALMFAAACRSACGVDLAQVRRLQDALRPCHRHITPTPEHGARQAFHQGHDDMRCITSTSRVHRHGVGAPGERVKTGRNTPLLTWR
jgi:hypothetical protein